MGAQHKYGEVGFHDEGKTKKTPDGLILDVFNMPPFRRKNVTLEMRARSQLLRRYYLVITDVKDYTEPTDHAQWAFVTDEGVLRVGEPVNLRMLEQGFGIGEIQDAMDYVQMEHRIRLVPYGFEDVVFWREHTRESSQLYATAVKLNRNQNLSHLLDE